MIYVDSEKINALRELEKSSGKIFVPALIKVFESEVPVAIKQMKTSANTNNFQELFLHAHKLKSSCFSLGAMRMGEICLEIETKSTQRDEAVDYHSLLTELENQFPIVLDLFKKL